MNDVLHKVASIKRHEQYIAKFDRAAKNFLWLSRALFASFWLGVGLMVVAIITDYSGSARAEAIASVISNFALFVLGWVSKRASQAFDALAEFVRDQRDQGAETPH